MEGLKSEQIKSVKARGFLRNRGTECFSGRVIAAGGVYTWEQLERISRCAHLYGNGKVAFTSRLSAEIVGIPYDKIDESCNFLEAQQSGLSFGGTGAKIRPVTACKGTTCVFGCCDTQQLAQELHQRYYIGKSKISLPHKFKIGIGGCPNSCMKPSLNDFGIEARRVGKEVRFCIYVGGTWGKTIRVGTPLSKLIEQAQICIILDKVLVWYQQNAQQGERFGAAIDRVGFELFEKQIEALETEFTI